MRVRAASLVLAALVVGSVVAVDPDGLAPFGPLRWLTISTLGLAGAGLAWWRGRRRLDRRSTLLWIALLVLLTAAALVGDDVPTALLGEPTRHLGLFAWMLFALLFCAGQQLDASGVQVLARASVVATAGIGVWSVWERIAGPPIDLAVETDRLTGPYGSAAVLGAACCLLVPVCCAVLVDRGEQRGWRSVAAVAATAGGWVLIESGSRAAWVGSAASVAVVVGLARPSRRALLTSAAVVFALVAVAAPRAAELTERAGGSTSRLDEWRVATRVIADHPFIGVGPEGYRIAVSEGIDRTYEREHSRDLVLPDRAHSGPLDVSLSGGIAAALAYLGLVVMVCVRAGRALGAARRSPTLAGLAVGVIAYSVQQLLLFPLAELDPLWWLFAGAIVAATDVRRVAAPVTWARWPAAAALVCAPLALAAGTLGVAADRLAATALAERDPEAAIDAAERAVRLRPDDVRFRMVAAEVLSERGTLADVDEAIQHTRSALDWSPNDPIAADRHASLLIDRAVITGDPADVDRAVRAWRRLVERDPLRARWQVQLGRAAALDGDEATARRAWATAADLGSETAVALLAGLDAR
ncbi:MAG: O-antigen ligase family protein [Ilumatobacteraceae bacterium]